MNHQEAMIDALHEIIDLAHTARCTWLRKDSTVEKYDDLVRKMAAIASNATMPETAIAQAMSEKWDK